MKWQILTIGKPKLPYARDGVAEYLKRLNPTPGVALDHLRHSRQPTESALLLTRSENSLRIALDERGDHVTSREFASRSAKWDHTRFKRVTFLIGGADGHSPDLRSKADWVWSLSPLTLQHELALVVLLEQIYRAFSIRNASPYHRD